MNKPLKETFDLEKTNHKTPALIFACLGIPALIFASMLRISHLEQSFVYNEEARISAAKDSLYKSSCANPRKQILSLTGKLEDANETSSVRMKDIYESGFKDHKLFKAGEQLVKGEKSVEAGCQRALTEVVKIKRGSSTNFVVSNFFGMK